MLGKINLGFGKPLPGHSCAWGRHPFPHPRKGVHIERGRAGGDALYQPRSSRQPCEACGVFAFFKKIYLLLAVLGLHCGKPGYSLAVVLGPRVAVASPVAEQGL